jgi:hypothetical protein
MFYSADAEPDLSITECFNATSTIGQQHVSIRCELSARPEVTSIRWIIDDNGTSVGEGEVINESWMLIMVCVVLVLNWSISFDVHDSTRARLVISDFINK